MMVKPRSRPHNPFRSTMIPGVGQAPDDGNACDVGMGLMKDPHAYAPVWANPAKNLGTTSRRR